MNVHIGSKVGRKTAGNWLSEWRNMWTKYTSGIGAILGQAVRYNFYKDLTGESAVVCLVP